MLLRVSVEGAENVVAAAGDAGVSHLKHGYTIRAFHSYGGGRGRRGGEGCSSEHVAHTVGLYT